MKDDSVLPDPNDKCPHGYLLKILNSLDSKSGALIEAQNQMMLFLSITDFFFFLIWMNLFACFFCIFTDQHGILCSKPVKNVEQKLMALAKIKGKFCFLFFFFRNMLQFIDQSVFQMVEIKTLFVSWLTFLVIFLLALIILQICYTKSVKWLPKLI